MAEYGDGLTVEVADGLRGDDTLTVDADSDEGDGGDNEDVADTFPLREGLRRSSILVVQNAMLNKVIHKTFDRVVARSDRRYNR